MKATSINTVIKVLCRPALLSTLLISTLLSSGCATLEGPRDPHDPWERFNRGMYKFNNAADKAVLKPVAKAYRKITPDPVEKGVSNVFSNIGDIQVIINDLLQFKPKQFLSDTGRFLINSTIGLFGIFDVATPIGLKKHREDFGQTLGRWGINSGPYLVLPLLGPSSARDGVGVVVDYQYEPLNEIDDRSKRNALYLLDFVNQRAQLLEAGDILDEAAFDPYIFLREAYLQRRRSQVYDGAPPVEENDDEDDIFTDDEEEIDIFSDE